MINEATYYLWHGVDHKSIEKTLFKGVTTHGNQALAESRFYEASKLDPNNMDWLFSAASVQLFQAKLDSAEQTYQHILTISPENFEAAIQLAAVLKVKGDSSLYDAAIHRLMLRYPEKTKSYIHSFAQTEKILACDLQESAQVYQVDSHTIIVLGYALNSDNTMDVKLIDRLKKALEIANLNPQSIIITSGGVVKGSVSEAALMKEWLISNGVDSSRIYTDNKSSNTVENAIYSTDILKKLNLHSATLVTSASHLRRALSTLHEVLHRKGMDVVLDHSVAMDFNSLDAAYPPSDTEKTLTYFDVIRGSGIWAFPGLQQ